MKYNIPEMMKAIFINNEDGSLTVRNVPVPKPKYGEVLVKIAFAPVNPSDIARIKSMTNNPEVHFFIPGIEGSGKIIAHGKGLLPKLWMGKRVACSSTYITSGTWAEYMVTSATRCFPIPEKISYEQGSMLLVNPMTAVAFFNIIKQDKHRAIINTAAAGALGRMISFLGNKHSVQVVNIVRNEKQKESLIFHGAKYVLNSFDADFQEQLKFLANKLNVTLALDAVGGELTQILLDTLPYKGSLIVYGNLSGNEQGVFLRPLVTGNKKVTGFYLANWIKDSSLLKTIRNIRCVKQMLKNDLEIKTQARFPLEEGQQAIDTYLNHMTEGKVLLNPNRF